MNEQEQSREALRGIGDRQMNEQEQSQAEPAAPARQQESTMRLEGAPDAITKLLYQLGQARADFETVANDTTGQFQNRTFKYADLSSIYRACIASLAKHGVTVFHPNSQMGIGVQRATTIVAGHGAMVIVSHDFESFISPDNIKGVGSAFTYLNRYQLRGLMAVAGDDDPDNDGSVGTKRFNDSPPSPPRERPRQAPARQEPPKGERMRAEEPKREPEREPTPTTKDDSTPNGAPPVDLSAEAWIDDGMRLAPNTETGKALAAALESAGFDTKDMQRAYIEKVLGRGLSTGPLTFGDGRKLLKELTK